MHVWFSLISPDSPRRDIPFAFLAVMIALLTVPACKREERHFQVDPTEARPPVGLGLSKLSVVAMIWADRAALHGKEGAVKVAMTLAVTIGAVLIGLRFREFHYLNCRWDDRAYSGIIWIITGMHLLHLIVGTAENLLLTAGCI